MKNRGDKVMKIFLIAIFVVVGFNACASKNHSGGYHQANSASKEAHRELMRDVH